MVRPHHDPLTLEMIRSWSAISLDDLRTKVRIVLETGQACELRDNYLQELHLLCTQSNTTERGWLQNDGEKLFFLTNAGERMPLVITPATDDSDAGECAVEEHESHHFVIDESGSMRSMAAAVYAGAREMVEHLPSDAVVTLTTFNDVVKPGERMNRDQALQKLGTRVSSGTTALRNAIVQAVAAEEAHPCRHTTLIVLTDGIDNASSATISQVRECVARVNARQGWRVLFLGANQDAIFTASEFGIEQDRALTFGTDRAPQAFRAVSNNVARYRSLGCDAFTATERTQSASVM